MRIYAPVEGLHFIAKGIAFRNTAGPAKGQAVALRSSSHLSVFHRCSIEGDQDTLMVHSQRQFYRQANVITAQGRTDLIQNTGISIHNSIIIPAHDLKLVVRSVKTYMGRPWMKYSRTVVLKTYIDSVVNAVGWSPWTKGSTYGLNTLFYAKYKNIGPASSTRWRVRWKGFHVLSKASDVSAFTVGKFIAGTAWLPSTGIPFTLEL
ncbi:unnamed protein product [Arabidopsis lyrata]|nr:unnamed protein product [Arabidopsis lyrata]